ncbi:unnamed protein product, partial [Rotaria magnacalcarata]
QLLVRWFSNKDVLNFYNDENDPNWGLESFSHNSTVNSSSHNPTRRFAVFACSIHSSTLAYIFYAPLIVAAWRRVGYEVIVIFVGDFHLPEATSPRFNITRRFLRRMGAIVLKIQSNVSYATKISQLIRVFVGLLPTAVVKDEDGLITTDADLIPINSGQYEFDPRSDGFLINPLCCGNFQRRGSIYRMLPMSHVYLKKRTWRAILIQSKQRAELLFLNGSRELLSNNAQFSFQTINLYAHHEFSDIYDQNMVKGDSAWYMDQMLLSMLLTDYRGNHPSLVIAQRNLTERLDRDSGISYWNRSSFDQFGDAHLPHDEIFTPHYWEILNKLLRFLFTDTQVNIFNRYYYTYKLSGKKNY